MRVIHRYQGFETKEAARAFVRKNGGYTLNPSRKRSDRMEYEAVRADGLDTAKYPYVVVWNEAIEG